MPIEKKEEAIKNVANKERKKFTEEKKEETRPPSKTLKEKINERINKQSNDSLNQSYFYFKFLLERKSYCYFS